MAASRSHLEFVRQNLMPTKKPAADEGELSLSFESDLSAHDIAGKLNAVQQIYSEACELFGVAESKHPLRVAKVETGTLWADFFGYRPIMDMLPRILEGAFNQMHSSFTQDGRMQQLPKNMKLLEEVIASANRMGLSPEHHEIFKQNMDRAVVKISDEAAKLLGAEPVFFVNGQKHSVSVLHEQEDIRRKERSQQFLDRLLGSPLAPQSSRADGELESPQ
jgi:hypothetical protein